MFCDMSIKFHVTSYRSMLSFLIRVGRICCSTHYSGFKMVQTKVARAECSDVSRWPRFGTYQPTTPRFLPLGTGHRQPKTPIRKVSFIYPIKFLSTLKEGSVAEWLRRRICNPTIPSSSPMTISRICSG